MYAFLTTLQDHHRLLNFTILITQSNYFITFCRLADRINTADSSDRPRTAAENDQGHLSDKIRAMYGYRTNDMGYCSLLASFHDGSPPNCVSEHLHITVSNWNHRLHTPNVAKSAGTVAPVESR